MTFERMSRVVRNEVAVFHRRARGARKVGPIRPRTVAVVPWTRASKWHETYDVLGSRIETLGCAYIAVERKSRRLHLSPACEVFKALAFRLPSKLKVNKE